MTNEEILARLEMKRAQIDDDGGAEWSHEDIERLLGERDEYLHLTASLVQVSHSLLVMCRSTPVGAHLFGEPADALRWEDWTSQLDEVLGVLKGLLDKVEDDDA